MALPEMRGPDAKTMDTKVWVIVSEGREERAIRAATRRWEEAGVHGALVSDHLFRTASTVLGSGLSSYGRRF